MARKTSPTGTNSTSITEVPGRVNSQDMEGFSSNTDDPRVSLVKALQSNSPIGRGPSSSGDGNTQKGDNKGDRVLPDSNSIASSRNPFRNSDNILQTIADRFVEARKLQKAEAWRQLQVDLMYASPFICPVIIPYKDLIGIVSEIEKEIKGSTAQVGKSNEEIMADFLSGGGSLIVAKLDLDPDLSRDEITIDNRANIETDEAGTGSGADIPLSTDNPHGQSPSSS